MGYIIIIKGQSRPAKKKEPEMNADQKKLKEAMKIILRDGKNGRLFAAAIARFKEFGIEENFHALAHELDGIDWTANIAQDKSEIEKMI